MNKVFFVLSLLFSFCLNAFDSTSCIDKESQTALDQFLKVIDKSLSFVKIENGNYKTGYNLKIEENCKERMPIKTLESFYRNTMAEGTLCLKNLSTIGPEGTKNIKCFNDLFANKSNPPKLLCGGWPFGSDIWAVGSFPGSSKRHPYLWLGPEISKLHSTNPTELKATIFHEMLHNCGYTHSEGVEFTYTCEECCFANDIAPDQKQSACNICAGKYQNENDPKYVKELLNWSRSHDSWARIMRTRAFEVATQMKNRESLYILLNETNIEQVDREKVIEILLIDNAEIKSIEIKNFVIQKNLQSQRTFQVLLKMFAK